MTSDSPVKIERRHLPTVAILVMMGSSAKSLVYLVVLAFFAGEATTRLTYAFLVLAGVVLVIVLGVLKWMRFQYWFEEGQFRVEEGLIFRKRAYIPLEKVQAVDITTGILQRILGLVKLEIKTGAAGSQATLTAVTRAEAERIRARLKPGQLPVAGVETVPSDASPRFGLTVPQLMLAGATSGRLGVVLSVVAWLFAASMEMFGADWIDEQAVESFKSFDPELATNWVLQVGPLFVAAALLGSIVVSWLTAVTWEVLNYGGFAVFRQGDDLVLQRGLFERRQITLPVHRIQAVRYQETLLRQPFGYGTLFVEAVGHDEGDGKASTLHPFIRRAESQRLIAELLPQFDVEIDYLRPPRRALPRFLIKPTLLFGIPLTMVSYFFPIAVLGLLALPLVWLVGYVSWRDTGLSLSEEIAVVRGRVFLGRTTAIVQRSTTQTVHTNASFLQRSRRLSSVTFVAASGPVGRSFTARDLDEADAWLALKYLISDI